MDEEFPKTRIKTKDFNMQHYKRRTYNYIFHSFSCSLGCSLDVGILPRICYNGSKVSEGAKKGNYVYRPEENEEIVSLLFFLIFPAFHEFLKYFLISLNSSSHTIFMRNKFLI